MNRTARAHAILLASALLSACTLVLPTDPAPGACAGVDEFSFVGSSTLRGLGFGNAMNQFDSDFDRPGRFWVTRDPVPLDAALEHAEAAARAAAQRMAADGQEPPAVGEIHRAPQRMLCVSWMDDNPTGLVEMSVPDDWAPPAD